MRDLINALEKLVGLLTGIVIGILTVLILSMIGIGIDIDKSYPGKLKGFLNDGSNNWKNWKIIDDSKGNKKTESEE